MALMTSAVSQLCRARDQLLGWFFQLQSCTVEQISPLFRIYLYLFLKFRRARVPSCFVGFQRPENGRPSCIMAEKEKSTLERSSLLSTVRERLLAKSSKKSQGEGISAPVKPSVKQLLKEKILSTPIEPESTSHFDEGNRKLLVNFTEGNFDHGVHEQSDQDVNRTPKRTKSGLKRKVEEGYEDEAAERKGKARKQSLCRLWRLSWAQPSTSQLCWYGDHVK